MGTRYWVFRYRDRNSNDHKETLDEEQKTSIEWKLSLPARLPMAEVDFCAMHGNLAENDALLSRS